MIAPPFSTWGQAVRAMLLRQCTHLTPPPSLPSDLHCSFNAAAGSVLPQLLWPYQPPLVCLCLKRVPAQSQCRLTAFHVDVCKVVSGNSWDGCGGQDEPLHRVLRRSHAPIPACPNHRLCKHPNAPLPITISLEDGVHGTVKCGNLCQLLAVITWKGVSRQSLMMGDFHQKWRGRVGGVPGGSFQRRLGRELDC